MKKAARFFAYGGLLSDMLALGLAKSSSALSLLDVVSGEYRGQGQPSSLFGGADAIIPKVINTMLFAVGVLAIIMMIYGGIRYVISNGDNSKVKDAKNTILYAIVGLVVAILGYAIVGWIINMLGTTGGGGTGDNGASVSLLWMNLG